MKRMIIVLFLLPLILWGCGSADIMEEQFRIQTAEVQSAEGFKCVIRYSETDREVTLAGRRPKSCIPGWWIWPLPASGYPPLRVMRI